MHRFSAECKHSTTVIAVPTGKDMSELMATLNALHLGGGA